MTTTPNTRDGVITIGANDLRVEFAKRNRSGAPTAYLVLSVGPLILERCAEFTTLAHAEMVARMIGRLDPPEQLTIDDAEPDREVVDTPPLPDNGDAEPLTPEGIADQVAAELPPKARR